MTRIWIIAAAAAALGASMAGPALADVKAGVDAWRQGDYAKAVAEWTPLAQAGDPDAQFNLGQAHKLGRGVPADLKVAGQWYRKAATQGHAQAEDNLGLLLFQQGDRTAALPYIQRSASRGEARAQYLYATSLFNGDLAEKDWVRAYAFMLSASQSGLPQAATSLAEMDKYMSDTQRDQGRKLAASLGKGGSSAALASAPSAPAPVPAPAPASAPARPAPVPVRTASVPPSSVAKPAQTVARPATPPAPAKPASTLPAPAASGGWRVQLGAFSEEGRARAHWSGLGRKVSGLSAYTLHLEKAGAITRLQAGPLSSSADADRLCRAVKAAGSDCMPRRM